MHETPPQQKRILALDLGTQLGWALYREIGPITGGSISFKPGRFEGAGMSFVRFRLWLNEIADACEVIDAVYFEEVRAHAGTLAAQVYGGFLAHLSAWCEECGIPYMGVPVGTIKKFATGKGNANKKAVIAAVTNKGFSPKDDNEADATALLLWALEQQKVKGE